MLSLLLSPAVFLVAAILALAVFAWRLHQRALALSAGGLALLACIATAPLPVHVFARLWSVSDSPGCAHPPPGATIVVLTGGATGSARGASELWRLDLPTFRRLVYGLDLARRATGSELLVSGGAGVGLTNEARIAEQFVLAMGWPADRLRIEDTSVDTYTSARDVRAFIQPGRPLVLVTSGLHMRRAAYVYRKAGMQPLPCSLPEPEVLIVPDSLIPNGATLARTSQAWKEVLGSLVYTLREPPATDGPD